MDTIQEYLYTNIERKPLENDKDCQLFSKCGLNLWLSGEVTKNGQKCALRNCGECPKWAFKIR